MPARPNSPAGWRPVLMLEEGGRGGVSDYAGELVRALAAHGRRVELVTASDHLYGEMPPGVRIHPIVRYFRPTSGWRRALRRAGLGKVINGLRLLAIVPRVTLMARRAAVVHSQGGEFLPLTALLALSLRAVGARLVYTPHNTFDRGRQFPRARRVLARCAGRTIVHVRADLAELPPRAAARAVVIPHGEYGAVAATGGGADREAARRDMEIDLDALVTLLFGALRPDKGLRDLLEAAAPIAELHVLIAGQDWGGLSDAAQLLADPVLEGRIHVREGFLDMGEAAECFAATDTVVLPYRQASQSGVLLLAYGFERPVIVYPVGGLPEAVEDGETGWVCARADPTALGEALRDAIAAGRQECLRRGEAGARLARERFSWDSIARRTEEVYRAVER